MALYAYKAMTEEGRRVYGQLDAINLIDLEMRLKRMELDLVTGDPLSPGRMGGRTKVTRLELVNFCFHLEQLSRAGVPILESLNDLRDSVENPRFREIIASVIESIEGGKALSDSLAEHPSVFDGVFVNLVKSGEDTGTLPDVLTNLVASIKWQDELAAQTKKLIMYPAFMSVVVGGVVLFMMIYLVPKMAGFIKSSGQALPMQTKMLMATSSFFVDYWYVVLITPVVVVGLLVMLIRHNSVARYRFDEIKLNIPYLGEIQRKIILSRFASVFAMMYQAGITILDSIKACENVVGNLAVQKALQRVSSLIGEGQNVTAAFQTAGLFPPLVIRMIKVGESTGELDKALRNVSYFYNRDVKESIDRVQAMIEPLMTVTVGVILGWIMLAVMGPMYDTITKLKF